MFNNTPHIRKKLRKAAKDKPVEAKPIDKNTKAKAKKEPTTKAAKKAVKGKVKTDKTIKK